MAPHRNSNSAAARKVGDVVVIWPKVRVTVERVNPDGSVAVVWFDANDKLHRKTVGEMKILS